jgi:ABC-type sugar transport system, permease component
MTTRRLGRAISYALLAIVTALAVFPFYMMLVMSTHESQEVVSRLFLLPGDHFLANGKLVIESGFLRFYWNSFYVAALASTLGVLISALAGFALSKYEFRLRSFFMNFVLLVMMIPFGVSIVGFLIEMRSLGWSNSHVPLIIAGMVSPYGVFLIAQFSKDGFPKEIMESARIDGCNEARIFISFFLPFTKAACFTLFLLIFISSWNNFMIPLIFVTKQKMYTIPLGIFAVGNQYRQEYGARLFALSFSTIPMLIIFALNSKNLIKGLTAGAIKG